MALRNNLQGTATRLIGKYGDSIQSVSITSTAGATEFDAPTVSTTESDIEAIVTGAGKYADGSTVLHSDLRVLVSGSFPVASVGDKMKINGKQYTIVVADPKLATGVVSAIIYFVRR